MGNVSNDGGPFREGCNHRQGGDHVRHVSHVDFHCPQPVTAGNRDSIGFFFD